jgi:predicted SnoaL-like aldol condensation-catalyzing enzyme
MSKKIIQNVFTNILENPKADTKLISKYFSDDYVQHVDGKTFEFDNFVKHIQTLKETIKDIFITVNTIIEENNIVFTNHEVKNTLPNGRKNKIKVIAEFRLKDGKIYRCDELTHMIEGHVEDQDIGSRIHS